MSEPPILPRAPRERGLFCNRTLNMRAIRAIGYDMDYTLVHYRIEAWEERAFEHAKRRLLALGLPVSRVVFDPASIIRGLIIDTKLGNIVKANRFGYVKQAFHGTKLLSFEVLRSVYSRLTVDLADKRWVFLNTLFSLSEACMFQQLVDLMDSGELGFTHGYSELYELTRTNVDLTHMEGKLKGEIMSDPDKFVIPDRDAAITLLDQKHAKKALMLITNSEWEFTRSMMSYAYDSLLPPGMGWRDLFDVVIVAARKPDFFSTKSLVFEIATPDGLLKPTSGPLEKGKAYFGGNASLVEKSLGVSGDEILYVGDHLFGDVNVTKQILRWRTALIVPEIEEEIRESTKADADLTALERDMDRKRELEARHAELRLALTRLRAGYGPQPALSELSITAELSELRGEIQKLDDLIAPLAKKAGEIANKTWGPLMWAGNDKSHFARQVERYADVYTSRVSNFAFATPFVYLRSKRGSLPHDQSPNPVPAGETARYKASTDANR